MKRTVLGLTFPWVHLHYLIVYIICVIAYFHFYLIIINMSFSFSSKDFLLVTLLNYFLLVCWYYWPIISLLCKSYLEYLIHWIFRWIKWVLYFKKAADWQEIYHFIVLTIFLKHSIHSMSLKIAFLEIWGKFQESVSAVLSVTLLKLS